MKRITKRSLFLSALIALTILLILCAQILNSFQILIQSDLLENGEIAEATPPRNMLEGARDLWKNSAKFLSVLLVMWSGIWPHVKLVALLFIIHTGIKFPRTVGAIEWLGRWAFLDVYFVVLVTLCFSMNPVKACMLMICEDVGWLQAVPRTGIFLFAFAAMASQCLSRATVRSLWYNVSYKSSKKRDEECNNTLKSEMTTSTTNYVVLRSWLAFGFTLLLWLCFLWSQLTSLFTVSQSTSLNSFVELPSPRSYSVRSRRKFDHHDTLISQGLNYTFNTGN